MPSPVNGPAYEEMDADNDGLMTEEEFSESFEETGVYNSWEQDGNGMLSEGKFRSALYQIMDDTGYGRVSAADWTETGENAGLPQSL